MCFSLFAVFSLQFLDTSLFFSFFQGRHLHFFTFIRHLASQSLLVPSKEITQFAV